MTFAKLDRVLHRWGSLLIALPLLLVISTGILLLLKKQVAWIQPPTQRGTSQELVLTFDQILEISKTVPDARIRTWEDIDRLDIRPSRGMVKVRSKSRWEIQLDAKTGEILHHSYRRSDLIESLHDGSFFHDGVKLGVFLPSALILLGLWVTGLYLFLLPYIARSRRKRSHQKVYENPRSEGEPVALQRRS
jgi:uncharacterized iron-regulated membrane protein